MNGAGVIPNSEMVRMMTARFLKPSEVSVLLGVSRKALADMRLERQGPQAILQRRGVVVYPVDSLKEYLRARKESQPRHGAREVRWSRAASRRDLVESRVGRLMARTGG